MTDQEFCTVRNNTHLSLNVLCFVTYRRGKKEKTTEEGRTGRESEKKEGRLGGQEGRRAGGRTRKFSRCCGTQSLK